MDRTELEVRVRRLGQEMFDRMRAARPTALESAWWQERLLQRAMRDTWLKEQSFRFVDALPAMRDDVDVARHLREFLVHPGGGDGKAHVQVVEPAGATATQARAAALQELNGGPDASLLHRATRLLNFRRLDSLPARLISRAARRASLAMARTFIAGSTVEEAQRAILELRSQGMAFTIDVLGEAALSHAEAEGYQRIYAELVERLPRAAAGWPAAPLADLADGRSIPRVNVSVKLTSLNPGLDAIDPEGSLAQTADRVRPLLRAAIAGGCHLHIDMEHYAIKDLTLRLFCALMMEAEFREYPHVGIALQAYVKDAERDAQELVAWSRRRGTPIWVRLVKGAYWDSETALAAERGWPCPVWEHKRASDACFERVTRILMENHRLTRCAFGSHNVRSLCHALALRQMWDVPGEDFEFQMLYGMGDPIKRAAVQMGQRVRVYTPYGELLPGMAYLIRRLIENTANESFLRASAAEDVPEEALLADPNAGESRRVGATRPLPRGEALTDFSRPENRVVMLDALARVRGRFGRALTPAVDPAQSPAGGEQWVEIRNPACPREIVARVRHADAASAAAVLRAAADVPAGWHELSDEDRSEYLRELARLLGRRRYELAALLSLACGKPWRDADEDVTAAIEACVTSASREMGLRSPVVLHATMYTAFHELAQAMCSAIASGGSLVVVAEGAAGLLCCELSASIVEVGIPSGVVSVVATETGSELLRAAGDATAVRTAAGAEQRGANCVLVDDDANPDTTIRAVLRSAFGWAGQHASSASRLIVHAAVHERFVRRLAAAAAALRIGPAEHPATVVPPVLTDGRQAWLRQMIGRWKQQATCVLEVDVSELITASGGYYIGPTIFDGVPADDGPTRPAVCGPVLLIQRVESLEEALRTLAAGGGPGVLGVFSRSPSHVEAVRRAGVASRVVVNQPTLSAFAR